MRRLLVGLTAVGILGFLASPDGLRLAVSGPTARIGDWYLTVRDVRTAVRAGAPYAVPADGQFYILTVHVIGTGPFEAELEDGAGRSWPRALDVERLVEGSGVRLVFDAPARLTAPVLLVRRPGSRTVVEIPLHP